jgi:hypothetical protein
MSHPNFCAGSSGVADRRRNVETLKAKGPRALDGTTLQLGVRARPIPTQEWRIAH